MMLPYLPDEPCPASDRYGTRQMQLQSALGTAFDQINDLKEIIRTQQRQLDDLRSIMMEIVALLPSQEVKSAP